jgi:hypothetical protein
VAASLILPAGLAVLLRPILPRAAPQVAAHLRAFEAALLSGRLPAAPAEDDAGGPTAPAAGPARGAEPLGIALVRPARATINFPDAPIEIQFTHPMDRRSVEAAFAVEPPLDGAFDWPAPTHLRFTPARPLPLGAAVTVRLGPGMREAGGARSLAPFAFTFPVVPRYSFAGNVGPWLRRACRECHGPEGAARTIPLATYADVAPLIVPGQASGSRLIAALDDPSHRTLPAPVRARKTILAAWIDAFQAAP